ncbi:hypothetical protein E2C01_067678 [Portunus trituberculatus]|uniref:Uncharacterized protein n=1 Tax=Portunus trituberculatus TaxID=210409 RepID=A0A5B7HPZ5_PORTR|nr:hypothetical protein [Portunus trituberculatus]
MTPSPAFL